MTGHVSRRIEAPVEIRHGLADHQAHEKEEGRVLRLRKDVARLGTELSTTREHFGARTTAAACFCVHRDPRTGRLGIRAWGGLRRNRDQVECPTFL